MADPLVRRRHALLAALASLLCLAPRRARALGPELDVRAFEGRKLVRARWEDGGEGLGLTFDDGRTLLVGIVTPPHSPRPGLWAGYLDPGQDALDRATRRARP